MRCREQGVSLLEYVVGLAVLAIVMVGVGLFFLSQPRQLDPVFQFRAVSLAEALVDEVLSAQYDDANNPDLQVRCSDAGEEPACVNAATADGNALGDFTQLDDFGLWCGDEAAIEGETLAGQLGLDRTGLYGRFQTQVCVLRDQDDAGQWFKRVTIRIEERGGSRLAFDVHRYNIR